MSLKKTFLIKEVFGNKDKGYSECERLASEVIRACELPYGSRGTLVSALYDAYMLGKTGKRAPENKPQDFDAVPF